MSITLPVTPQVGAARRQHLDHLGAAGRGGEHQRRLSPLRLARVQAAPASSSASRSRRCPAAAAKCSGTAPVVVTAPDSAPRASSARTTAAWPRARREVERRVAAEPGHRRRRRRRRRAAAAASSALPRSAAQCSAVMPSPWGRSRPRAAQQRLHASAGRRASRRRRPAPRAARAGAEAVDAAVRRDSSSDRPAQGRRGNAVGVRIMRAASVRRLRARTSPVESPNCSMSSRPTMCIADSITLAIGVPAAAR